jgi:hypothetical protein
VEYKFNIQELALFLRGCLYKGLYYRYKGKGYVIEVVIITKKLLLNGFKDIKNSVGKV